MRSPPRRSRRCARRALSSIAAALALGSLQRAGIAQEPAPAERPPAAQEPAPAPNPAASQEAAAEAKPTELRAIRITTRDVFTDEEASRNVLYRFVNWLHAVTDEAVIRREAWFQPGDTITDDEIEEYERNLRAMGIFADVHAKRVDNPDGTSDVEVDTHDRLSLLFSAGASFVGGSTSYNAALGERNLFGSGKQLYLTGNSEEDHYGYDLRYVDPQLFGSWHRLTLDVGATDEGQVYGFDLRRPFKFLDDPYSYGVSGSSVGRAVDYYRAGSSVASVPEQVEGFDLFGLRAFGPRDLRGRVGLDLRGEQADFDPTEGSDPGFVTAPDDYRELAVGLLYGVDWNADFQVLQHLDALGYDEDVTLGVEASMRTALAARETDAATEHQPIVELDLRAAAEPARRTYLTGQFAGGARWSDGDVVAYRTRAAAHAYQKSLPAQTLAASLLWDAAEDDQGLPVQLTLGEDNGLRGYPARQFAGTRELVLNLEDRIDTGLELWSVHVGLVGFFDMGLIDDEDQGVDFGDPLRSVGFGLRFGSSELFGRRVFRLDVAWPLDDAPGESFGVSISASVGQVFGFFGNQTALSTEFGRFFD